MSALDKLEKRLGFLAIHNLTLYIVIGQLFLYGVSRFGLMAPDTVEMFQYSFQSFLDFGPWRIFTVLLIPSFEGTLSFLINLYFLYFIGSSLESHWGAFRYNLFLGLGLMGILVTSLLIPYVAYPNFYIYLTLVMAAGYLFPNFEIMAFFVLPVKLRWLGWISFGYMAFEFLKGGLEMKLVIVGSAINFPIFFGAEFIRSLRSKKRVAEMKASKRRFDSEPFHVCSVCGATDQTAPDREFRYRESGAICSDCLGKETEQKDA